MSVELSYMYRDSNNSKAVHTLRFIGTVDKNDVAQLRDLLSQGIYFNPKDVGLRPLQDVLKSLLSAKGFENVGDDGALTHPWHEVTDLFTSAYPPIVQTQWEDVFDRFRRSNWSDADDFQLVR